MKKRLYSGLIIALVLLLCACTGVDREGGSTTRSTHEVLSTQTTADDVTTSAIVDTQETTAPTHSALYLPQYSTQQIIEYFEEIVLHIEYTDGIGNPALVQKWDAPIRYRIFGDPTEEDLRVLADLFTQLNKIVGFPGIYAAVEGERHNLTISFLDPKAFTASFSKLLNGEDAYGAAQFWYYIASNEIHTANVGYRIDIDQTTRISILIEEIINMLGVSDTVLREDSIVYQYSDDNIALSDVDWVILKLLYNPAIQSGMDVNSCRAIIQELYY